MRIGVLSGLLAVMVVLLGAPRLERIIDELSAVPRLIVLLGGVAWATVRRDDAAAPRVALRAAH